MSCATTSLRRHLLLTDLPPEILWHIVSHLSLADLAIARLVSRKLRHFCDHPSHWRCLKLQPSSSPPSSKTATTPLSSSSSSSTTTAYAMSLWQLADLEALIQPHVAHIKSIQIWGVRDNVVRYLLQNCHQLEDLALCGWTTLSNHAFKLQKHGPSPLRLRRLELIGAAEQPNYAAIDARQLAELLAISPNLTELVLGCQIHIHARTFLKELKKRAAAAAAPLKLASLTLATRRSWSRRHVAELMDQCSALERVCLLPAAAKGFDLKKDHTTQWSIANKPQIQVEPSSDVEDDNNNDAADMFTDMIVLRSSIHPPAKA
ncbi:hypothetical protein BX666DRAFT_1947391 [Dichotomocladium elegans]|nr:hypothetical protein BX666DRAFT_1947391 [Dichotomocladium elegans]